MPQRRGAQREWPPGSPKARRNNGSRWPWRELVRTGPAAPTDNGAHAGPEALHATAPMPEPIPEFPGYDSLPFDELEPVAEVVQEEPRPARRRWWRFWSRPKRPAADAANAPEPSAEPAAAAMAEPAETEAVVSVAPATPDLVEPDVEADDSEALEEPTPLGPRRARGALRERERRRRLWGAQAAVLVAGIVAIAVVAQMVEPELDAGTVPSPARPVAGSAPAPTSVLLAGTDAAGDVVWMSLLFSDPDEQRGGIVYVPAHTAAEVPGRGLLALGDAHGTGDPGLLSVATANLLGVDIDETIVVGKGAAAEALDGIGTVAVDVPEEVREEIGPGESRVAFPAGLQDLSARDATRLLYTVGEGADDVELAARHLAFWDAVLARYAGSPAKLGSTLASGFRATGTGGEAAADAGRVLAAIAGLRSTERSLAILPVRQVSVGEDELYATNTRELRTFITDTLGDAAASGGTLARVQILNGVGTPGVGRQAAEKLVGRGFQVVLSGNARSFDYEQTLVIAYGNEKAARRAKALLGVGKVRSSGQQQGIVDVTVVIGKDFLRTR